MGPPAGGPARARAGGPTGRRGASPSPAEPAASSVRAAQNRKDLRSRPRAARLKCRLPGPRAPGRRAVTGARGAPAWALFKNLPVILTQALHGNLREFRRQCACRGSVPSPARAGRSRRPGSTGGDAGARGEGLEIADPAADTCLHLPPGAGAAPTWPRSPQNRLRRVASSPSLPGRRPWGERGATGSCGWGNRGKEGEEVRWGTMRRPEPSAWSGGASRSLQQRRPNHTRAPGVASRAPRFRGAGHRRASSSWQAGRTTVRCDHTPRPKFIYTHAPPGLTPRKRVVTVMGMKPLGARG